MRFDDMKKSAMIGIRMLNYGYVSRDEFSEMIRAHRAQYKA